MTAGARSVLPIARLGLLALMPLGCAVEGGFGGSAATTIHDSALRAQVGASVRTPRGPGPFAGGDLTFAPAPMLQLRSLQLRAGYAWWFFVGTPDELGVELSVRGGLGASPYGADQERPLQGYHLSPSVALPIVLSGGPPVGGGFVVGALTWLLVPEVSAGWWFAPGVPASDYVVDVAAVVSVRLWFRTDLATVVPPENTRLAP